MGHGIKHMVVFNLVYPKDSPEAKQFIKHSVEILGSIPQVHCFTQCYEVSQKNNFDYGFCFDFLSQDDYDSYSRHPAHSSYVKDVWEKEVSTFMEIDLVEL